MSDVLTNDPASYGRLSQVTDDECNDRAGSDNNEYLSHNGKAGDEDNQP